ncbi:MAG: gamma carbonic anhydrase family protein [Gammaproteobacteria bacterium]|nr:gamma carbonic anhydrase family protein [Gammaproteobacteria bacterium]
MTIRHFKGINPKFESSTYIDSDAHVSGDVIIGADSSVWPMVAIRGDVNCIRIGERSNIQDGSVLHVTHASALITSPEGSPLIIGDNVTIGHNATVHACTLEDECLIGMGAVVLDNAVVEKNAFVGAGAVVGPGKIIEGGYMWLGAPAKRIRPLTEKELAYFAYSAQHYVTLKDEHLAGL